MDAGDFKQLKQYLKENLNIQIDVERGHYGESGYLNVTVFLEGEQLTTGTTSISNLKED